MKQLNVEDLAIFSGQPAYDEPLHVGRPNIGDKHAILSRISDILDRRWLTNDGPCVRELEAAIAARAGVNHCICLCNGTVALEILIRALGLHGEVIVPSFTFVATAHALTWLGLTPIFADVNPRTHSIDAAQVERLITPRTTAIMGVHLWGIPCAVRELAELASRHRLKLVYDAAHAFACTSGTQPLGSFGNAEVYSFHATKFFNTFEGGAIVTNDAALADSCRRLRNFGFEGFDNVTSLGTNGKMPEVCAAMGLESLRSLESFIEKNRQNWSQYARLIAELPGLEILQYAEGTSNFQYVVVTVDPEQTQLTRDELVSMLRAENVLARRYFTPGIHRMRAYRERYADVVLPVTDSLSQNVLCLPTGTTISSDDITLVCSLLRAALSNPAAVRQRLSSPT
jgi:dTDP-4-amino-4,6-dideoxygalactose transaminase